MNNQFNIYVENFGNLSVKVSNFTLNSADYAADIYLFNSNSDSVVEISDCFFIETNTTNTKSYGGSVYLESIGNGTIMRSYFSKNLANYGAGLFLYNQQLNSIFEIADCFFIENEATIYGGAVYIVNTGNTLFVRNIFSKNLANYGGAIFLYTSQTNSIMKIIDCNFIENESKNYGGAIEREIFGNTSIIRTNFSKNFAYAGTAMIFFNSQNNSLLIITDCKFSENNSTNYGGAIYMANCGDVSIIRSYFSNNFAVAGGAILFGHSQLNSLIQIADCVFLENNSTTYGGAIYMEIFGNALLLRSNFSNNFADAEAPIYLFSSLSNSMMNVIDCIFFENNSTTFGGAIYMEKSGNTSIFRTEFRKNLAESGAAIYVFNSQPNSIIKIVECDFSENNSTSTGGVISMKIFGNISILKSNFSNNFANYGSCIYLFNSQPDSLIEISDCVFFENNSTTSGSAIYIENFRNSFITRNLFSKNFADHGAAICLYNSQYSSIISDCDFNENNSTTCGSAIFVEHFGNTSIINSKFSNNFADCGAAIYLFNSKPYSFFEIVDCNFIENNCTSNGGALYMQSFGNALIKRCNFSNNNAPYGGAIYVFNQSTHI